MSGVTHGMPCPGRLAAVHRRASKTPHGPDRRPDRPAFPPRGRQRKLRARMSRFAHRARHGARWPRPAVAPRCTAWIARAPPARLALLPLANAAAPRSLVADQRADQRAVRHLYPDVSKVLVVALDVRKRRVRRADYGCVGILGQFKLQPVARPDPAVPVDPRPCCTRRGRHARAPWQTGGQSRATRLPIRVPSSRPASPWCLCT